MGTRHLTQQFKDEARALGFVACGIAEAAPLPETRDVIQARVARGSYDGLPWFSAERETRAADAERSLGGTRSVVTVAAP